MLYARTVTDISGIKVEDWIEFEKALEKLRISFTYPFFEKVFFPRLEQGFQADELDSIKLLLKISVRAVPSLLG
jgi:hypothetical protein